MKFTLTLSLRIIAALFILTSASCSSGSKPDLSKGLKVTIRISLKDAIASAAINPDDSTIWTALNSTDSTQISAEAFTASFLDIYTKKYPNEQVSKYFISGSSTAQTPAQLKQSLLATINNKRSEMAKTVAGRIEQFCGIAQKNITVDFNGQLMVVYIPGITDKKQLDPVFDRPEGLRIWATYKIADIGSQLVKVNDMLSQEIKTAAAKEIESDRGKNKSLTDLALKEQPEQNPNAGLFNYMMPAIGSDGEDIGASYIGVVKVDDTAKVTVLLQKESVRAILPKYIKWTWGALPASKPKDKIVALYAIHPSPQGEPLINAHDVQEAKTDKDRGKWEIMFSMTPTGALKWERATAENINKALAIEVGNYVYSAPNVIDKISGGRCSLTGDFEEKEAMQLAGIIAGGGYPLDFKIISIEPFGGKK